MQSSPSDASAVNRQFLEVVRDPRIVPGVHHFCDEWCDTCPLTNRCLAFRCTVVYRKSKARRTGEPTFLTTGEAIAFARGLARLEGLGTPEIDALVSGSAEAAGFRTSDPLASAAWEYAVGVSLWLILLPDELRRLRVGTTPAPEEVVLWFHLRIYLKLVRALVARDRKRAGRTVSHDEALGCAKLTLVSVQRSRRALYQLKTPLNIETVTPLLNLLDRLERGIDDGFPGARGFVRLGLDVPVV